MHHAKVLNKSLALRSDLSILHRKPKISAFYGVHICLKYIGLSYEACNKFGLWILVYLFCRTDLLEVEAVDSYGIPCHCCASCHV